MAQGLSNYLRNKIVDWYLRGVAHTPPTDIYIRLVSGTPTPSTGGTQLSGTGYAPVAIAQGTTTWAATNAPGSTAATSSGTSGTSSNNAIVNFGTAGSNWGTASHWEAWDASSGGNLLFYGEIVDGGGTPTPRTIVTGDPVSFPISGLQVIWA